MLRSGAGKTGRGVNCLIFVIVNMQLQRKWRKTATVPPRDWRAKQCWSSDSSEPMTSEWRNESVKTMHNFFSFNITQISVNGQCFLTHSCFPRSDNFLCPEVLLEWTPAKEAQFHVKLLITFTVIRLLGPKKKRKN